MEIRKRYSLLRLLGEAFALVARCGGAIAGYILIFLLFTTAKFALLWMGVPLFMLKLSNLFFSAYVTVGLFRIFAAKAEQTGESFFTSLSAALFPSFYQVILSILYAAVWFIYSWMIFFSFKDKLFALVRFTSVPFSESIFAVLTLIATLTILLYVTARLLYAPVSIALRNQGPIAAILYSFQMTSGKDIFTALAALLISFFLPIVYLAAVLYGAYTMIPLYFADSFNLAALSPVWWAVLIALAVGYLFMLLLCPAFLTLVFLNQDYGQNRESFTPPAELKIAKEPKQVFGPDNNILPPSAGNLVRPEDVGHVDITQSSVSATPDDGVTEQHLQQVYQPQPEEPVQYIEEEDRMPTILFDDDMARQIEEERARWQQKYEQDKTKKGEDDAPSVKMSK